MAQDHGRLIGHSIFDGLPPSFSCFIYAMKIFKLFLYTKICSNFPACVQYCCKAIQKYCANIPFSSNRNRDDGRWFSTLYRVFIVGTLL